MADHVDLESCGGFQVLLGDRGDTDKEEEWSSARR